MTEEQRHTLHIISQEVPWWDGKHQQWTMKSGTIMLAPHASYARGHAWVTVDGTIHRGEDETRQWTITDRQLEAIMRRI